MPELDTIRGIAILAVVLYHGLYWQIDLSHYSMTIRLILSAMWLGRLGVDLFFVLSGFLITGILVGSRNRESYYRTFYVRRALRILPIYLVVLGFLAISRLVPASFAILSLFYLSNLTPLWGIPLAYPVLWSLAVEEHFYFLFPAAVRHIRNKFLIWICVFVIAVTPISRLISFYVLERLHGFVTFKCNDYTWNCLDGLACGALLALVLREYQLNRATLWRYSVGLIALSVAALLAGIPFGILDRHTAQGAALQVIPFHFAFTGLLAVFLLVGTGPWRSLVRIPSLKFLGYISYGLYLVHLLGFMLVDWIARRPEGALLQIGIGALMLRFAFAAAISVIVAFLSRKYFEEWFLSWKDRLSHEQAKRPKVKENIKAVAGPVPE
ncbi:MAG TPA: acyltransferase [Dongiaceae bacterium]|nr:acyltransferase [Dongiaceae bacterium]